MLFCVFFDSQIQVGVSEIVRYVSPCLPGDRRDGGGSVDAIFASWTSGSGVERDGGQR